ncbi:hypothetical protein GCM10011349_30790 [Novosphingobium indicum]|uniref:Uncharacterized protein n=1 Tax=Novosphingobium indicum TaxID=462949 RepID=A0ABQ2JUR7_9SPHN|nr:hypothetical protein GCM10011349_30790 [Novosphingobium indicum]
MFREAANCGHDQDLAMKRLQFETDAERNPPEIDTKFWRFPNRWAKGAPSMPTCLSTVPNYFGQETG